MGERFLGVPLFVWGVGCLIVAGLFAFVVPHPSGDAVGVRQLLLRWGHAGVWLLLAFFCLARAMGVGALANILGFAAGLLYAAFIVTLIAR